MAWGQSGGMGVWGGGERMSSWSARFDPERTKEDVDHSQNNSNVKAVGTSPLRSN